MVISQPKSIWLFLIKNISAAMIELKLITDIKPLEPWDEPRVEKIPYPASAGDEPETDSAITVSWATGDSTDASNDIGNECT